MKKFFKSKLSIIILSAVLIAVVVTVLLLSVGGNAVMGGKNYKVTSNMMLLAYQQYYENYITTNSDNLITMGLDPTKPLAEQTSKYHFDETGKARSWRSIMVEDTVSDLTKKLQLCEAAKVAGFTLDQTKQAELDTTVQKFDIEKSGIKGLSKQEVQRYFEIIAISENYKDHLFDSITISDEEIADQKPSTETYSKNVRHILIEGETADAEQTAKDLLEEWKSGEATEQSFAALAKVHSDDPATKENGGLYENVRQSEMTEGFENWVFQKNRKPGDCDIVKTTYGYHLMYFVGDGEAEWKIYAKSDLKNKKYNDKLIAVYAGYLIEEDTEKINELFQ